MALSSYPTPADAGMLCIILANTAISISIIKELISSILSVIGFRIASRDEYSPETSDLSGCRLSPSESYMDEFRSRTPAMRYDSIVACGSQQDQECSICLSEFEPKAEINRLSCGHVFHKPCLEKWLKYWNTTCPLCRNFMMPRGEEDVTPM
ncbi:hypothetical protein CASFOL_022554 [Castilleja foliolosa]|uniref:RING-type domain-containing protein n=1 Tax=Castilleja foliolosa TaxID=1961234 RepID=A0ABD3CVU6_9LAMI